MHSYCKSLVAQVKMVLRDLAEKYAGYEDVLELIPYPPLSVNYDPTTSVFEDTIRAYDIEGFFKLVWGYAKGDYDPELRRWMYEPGVPFRLGQFPPGMFVCVFVCWIFCLLTTHPLSFQRSNTASISSVKE